MSFKVNGKLTWEGQEAMMQFDGEQKKALIKASILVKKAAIDNLNKQIYSTPETPSYKRTGALRASIHRRTFKTDAIVGTTLDYAPYVELGTRKTPSRPFLKPAYLLNINKIIALFAKFYKGVKYVD